MDTHFAQHLMRLLAQAATLISGNRPAAFSVLQQASALLWRLTPDSPKLSVIELESKLSMPIEGWLPDVIRGDYIGALLSFNMATQTCNEMMLELNAKQLWEDAQSSVNRVKQACRLRSDGEILYRNFRIFLIEHGVIEPAQARDVFVPLNLSLAEFYEPIPLHLRHDGMIFLCPECRWPMNAQRHEVSCDSAWCLDKKSVFVREGHKLVNRVNNSSLLGQEHQERLMLKPPLWKFTLQPGLLELALAASFAEKGIQVQLWPDVDRTDLRLQLSDRTQDIDAKVWISVYELAKHIETLPDRATHWIVIPDYQRPNIALLRKICPPGIQVFTQNQCVKEVLKNANPF